MYKYSKDRGVATSMWADLMTFQNAWALQIMKYFVNNKRTAKDTRNDASTSKLQTAFSLAARLSKLPRAKGMKRCDFPGMALDNSVRIDFCL